MKVLKKLVKGKNVGIWFVLPALLYMLVFIGYPLVYNFVLSFKNLSVTNFASKTAVFVGLENYSKLFHDEVFLLSMKNTTFFTVVCLLVQFALGFALALFFYKKFPLSGPIRGILLVAYMMPMSVVGLLGKNMFGVTEGVINDILLNIGILKEPVSWLISSKTAIWGVIIMNCWVGIPFNMLLLTTGLSNISEDVYESARIDGAGKWRQFWSITVPLLRPAILSVLMLGLIYTFKVFDLVYIMTSGGPVNSTQMMATYAYTLSFGQYQFSLGSAAAVVLFMCLFLVGLFYLRLTAKEEAN
ncbi:MAG: carbohydrate ABC transporter permease [Lachnospiraceae bacterium]